MSAIPTPTPTPTPTPRSTPTLRHKTLSAYYPNIQSILSYLTANLPTTSILLQTDSTEYHALLNHTLCATRLSEHDIPLPEPGSCFGTQQEAIDRVLNELGRQGRKVGESMNVLLAGNRNPSTDLAINVNRPQVENRHANSPSSVLRSLPWKILRSRIGDAGFRHLLIYTSIYLPIGNNCYMQLTGLPIYDLYDHPGVDVQGAGTKRKAKIVPFRRHKKRRKDVGDIEEGQGQKRTAAAEINILRQRMFYGKPARSKSGSLLHGLPPDHLLNRLTRTNQSPDNKSCLLLIQKVFPHLMDGQASLSKKSTKPKIGAVTIPRISGSERRLPGIVGVTREILVRHSRVDYGSLLRRCLDRLKDPTTVMRSSLQPADDPITQADPPITGMSSVLGQGMDADEDAKPERATLLQAVSHSQVCRFVTSVLRSVLSTYIMGSEHNLSTIIRHARTFIRAKQYEAINLHSVMQGIRINDFSWPAIPIEGHVPPQETIKRRRLVEEFVFWLFDDFLIPLLKNSFYITETAATRYETVYYSHRDWLQATEPHYRKLEDTLLVKLGESQKMLALRGPLGVSAVRLIPKPDGFRPIVNLGRKINIPGMPTLTSGKYTTANQVLRPLHQVLTYEKDRKRSLLGSSLFGTNEIFSPLQSLKSESHKSHGKLPRMYFVKMDIKAAFDTIKQDKMLEVIEAILDKSHDYCLLLYCLLLPPASRASQGSARRLFKSRAIVNDELSSGFGDHAKEIARPLRNAVVVDLVRRRQVEREACMDLLRTHIKNNIWQVQDDFYRQKTGIPQGSKLGSLLCSFFYAFLEAEHLSFLQKPGTRLLRYIDDFLCISDDYYTAKRFVEVMRTGFPAYGAFISPSKTLLSFEYATGSQVVPICGVHDGRSYFPYCGFLIDIQSLDLSLDYPRTMLAHVRQTFALRNSRRRGKAFVGWFSRQLENRNHVAYLDTTHNLKSTVHFNIFVNFALTSMKIPYYFAQSGSRGLSAAHAHMIFEAVRLSAEYTHVAGRARVLHAARGDENHTDHYGITKSEFMFLSLSATKLVLEKKSQYSQVVEQLKQHLKSHTYSQTRRSLKETVERGWITVKEAKY